MNGQKLHKYLASYKQAWQLMLNCFALVELTICKCTSIDKIHLTAKRSCH